MGAEPSLSTHGPTNVLCGGVAAPKSINRTSPSAGSVTWRVQGGMRVTQAVAAKLRRDLRGTENRGG